MKLAAARAGSALDRPDPAVRLYLLSGADSSASRFLAQRLLKALGAEKVTITGTQLKSDPRWLSDEAASMSMFGDKRLLWIEPAGEDVVAAVTALLDLPQVESPAVAIASSSLKGSSQLAKLADKHPAILHIVSEQLSPREQVGSILELARSEGLGLTPALAERVAEEANGDLTLARLELQKFALYLDASPEAPRELDEEVVDALGIDQAEADYGRPGDLALSGDLPGLGGELILLQGGAVEPIPIVRALQRRLLMLAPLRARLDNGQRPDMVMGTVWKRDKAVVGRILPRWTSDRLAEAFARVQRLERDLLLKPLPGPAALGETLLQLARAAARR